MKLIDLIQLITGIAVLIGLGLVVWELQQTRTLTRAQLTSDHWSEVLQNSRALLGENPAPILAKSCDSPESLSAAERAVTLAALDIRYFMAQRSRTIEEIADLGAPWELVARSNLRALLSNPIGLYDYETFRDERWSNEYEPIIQELLANEDMDCDFFWKDFEKWLHQHSRDAA